jgi:hypothetical protein
MLVCGGAIQDLSGFTYSTPSGMTGLPYAAANRRSAAIVEDKIYLLY